MSSVQSLSTTDVEQETQRYAAVLWDHVQRDATRFGVGGLTGGLVDWAMHDEGRKAALLRLIDVLPALDTAGEVAEHIESYLADDAHTLPAYLRLPVKLAAQAPFQAALTSTFRSQVRRIARRFIVGSDVDDALPILRAQWDAGFAFTADLLGEKTLTPSEADAYERTYLRMIDTLSVEVASWSPNHILESDATGAIPRANVSVKLSALDPSLSPLDPEGGAGRLAAKLAPLMVRAKEQIVFVNFDMEDWALREIVMRAFERCVTAESLRAWPHVGIVIQAYLRSAMDDAERLLELVHKRGAPVTVRLVKGAYWDYEVAIAEQDGTPCPVYLDKESTDANFEELSAFLLEHADELRPAFASHNLRSLTHAIVRAKSLNVDSNAFEIQMLYGMAEPEQRTLRDLGHRVRLYSPIGELIPGMGYLVRRLLENTSNQGFLRQAYRERLDMNELLRRPLFQKAPRETQPAFTNASLLDFSDPVAREKFAGALSSVSSTFPIITPIVIDGEHVPTSRQLDRECPHNSALHVARVALASREDALQAVSVAKRAWPEWSARTIEERAGMLDTLADRLEKNRNDLAAIEVYETGKPWREADADVAEAIDFCRYYARQAMVELGPRALDSPTGETNVLFHVGRGPAAIIAPWNFPIAILCGMTTAALVAGNTVLMKPSEQSSACAYALFQHMQAAGFPGNVIHFLPGSGEEVGAALVAHPDVTQIAFTGSKEVGLSILKQAGTTAQDQTQVKSVVCEMGGKNAIIVDEDADLDEALAGVLSSAFEYAGQKCSACSRLILVGAIAERFTQRLIEACGRLRVAPADDPACDVGPVIDETAYTRLLSVIANPGPGAELLYMKTDLPNGYFVPPTVFRVKDRNHRLMQQELFGPVLTVFDAMDFDEALKVALSTEFALTGGLYSRNPKHIAIARERFRVGNLYINRGCTGAKVGRQPFGGFGMSGSGTKAGGPGYLPRFAVPRCVTENTMRKGFTPGMDGESGE
ncbi:MAG: proline dehydrogenase family protein [Candidatus Hydrogenedentes bacterium]|nr:proline dehydrogenase family protein [Candidatus Hydrogenedentota bacterium]